MRSDAQQLPPSAMGQAPLTIHGEDVRQWLPHWREGRPRRLELRLAGDDVVLLDMFALRLLHEIYLDIAASRRASPGAT